MNNTTTNKEHATLVAKMINGIKGAWRSYSKAVDMAYNRGHVNGDEMNTELCMGGGGNIAAKKNGRPIKASAFDDHSSY